MWWRQKLIQSIGSYDWVYFRVWLRSCVTTWKHTQLNKGPQKFSLRYRTIAIFPRGENHSFWIIVLFASSFLFVFPKLSSSTKATGIFFEIYCHDKSWSRIFLTLGFRFFSNFADLLQISFALRKKCRYVINLGKIHYLVHRHPQPVRYHVSGDHCRGPIHFRNELSHHHTN